MPAPAGTPAAVVLPRSTDDVVPVMRTASRHGVPVVPRGSGSGLAGASNAVDGAITLVMTRMDPAALLNPGKVFRTAAAGDLVAVAGLTAER
jgi:FAD/FMN-containing dehydrogenase